MNLLLRQIETIHTLLSSIRDSVAREKDIPDPVQLRLQDLTSRARELCLEIDREQRNQFLQGKGSDLRVQQA